MGEGCYPDRTRGESHHNHRSNHYSSRHAEKYRHLSVHGERVTGNTEISGLLYCRRFAIILTAGTPTNNANNHYGQGRGTHS